MKIASPLPSLLAPLFIACTSVSTPITVSSPPELSLASIGVAGTPADNTWTKGNSIQPTLGCKGNPLIVNVSPEPIDSVMDGFTLAVPGNCSTTVACGWLVLRVDPGLANEIVIATRTVPITVDEPIEPGSHTISIELHDAYDRLLLDSDNTPVGDSVTVEFLSPSSCTDTVARDAG